uniref:Succinate dehydrogenase assembly factor 2, mitochondrial n=1 Tax=Culicoides sonorensis TaxID=179676 RepID=A0A336M7F8_CULSO
MQNVNLVRSQVHKICTQFIAFRPLSVSGILKTPHEGEQPPPMVDVQDHSVPIPEYKAKQNEPMNLKKQRLLYQSRKRGMLENGLLLSTFAAKYLEKMTPVQVSLYDKLINLPTNDWDIFYWATKKKPTPPQYDNEIMVMLQEHVANKNKEERIRQPDLFEGKASA